MNIKLIASDMDGTLLNDNRELPPGFFDMVERLHERGVRFAVASGRQYHNLRELFAPAADKLIFLAENGSLLMDGDEQIYICPIPLEKAVSVYRAAVNIPDATVLLCGAKAAYLHPTNEAGALSSSYYYASRVITEDPVAAVREAGDSIVKIAIFHPEEARESWVTDCISPHADDLNCSLAGKYWLDCMHPDVNKGTAMRFLLARLGLTKAECMSFGDYNNDIALLQETQYSYAMENAVPDVKAVAAYSAPSNNDHGVIKVIREYFPGV